MNPITGKIIFAGGGTGGHVYPALATIEALRDKGNFEILYVGGYRGVEKYILANRDIAFKTIWISGFQRYFTIKNLLFFIKLIIGLIQSIVILMKFKPNVVVGTGGYVSGPVLFMAAKFGYSTLVQEQDSYPGVTTRLLARYVDIICLPYNGVNQHLKKVKGEVKVTGNPIRKSLKIVEKSAAASQWNFKAELPIIFVFGGSQGAQSINKAIFEFAEQFIQKYNTQFIWQTGKRNFEEYKSTKLSHSENILIKDYIDIIDMAYSAADIIICRAGAVTLAELSIVAKPCILVPYPHAAANHQEKNATTIEKVGAAIVVREGKNFKQDIFETLKKLLENSKLRKQMSEKWKKIQQPQAADAVAQEIIRLI